jgi:hypothetical protein
MVTHDVDLATRAPREVHVLDGRVRDVKAFASSGAGGAAPQKLAAAYL